MSEAMRAGWATACVNGTRYAACATTDEGPRAPTARQTGQNRGPHGAAPMMDGHGREGAVPPLAGIGGAPDLASAR